MKLLEGTFRIWLSERLDFPKPERLRDSYLFERNREIAKEYCSDVSTTYASLGLKYSLSRDRVRQIIIHFTRIAKSELKQ